MAAANILTTGTGAADSGDVVVAAGTPLTVSLKGVSGNAKVRVMLKDDAAAYHEVYRLTYVKPAAVITAPGTYLFRRVTGGTCGVFSA